MGAENSSRFDSTAADGKPLVWRYGREQEVLYVRVEQQIASEELQVTCHSSTGMVQGMRYANLVRLYDALHRLEQDLAADGWELLAVNRRAADRLQRPTCERCSCHTVEAVARTTTHVLFRCNGCHREWSVIKPGVVTG